MKHVKGAFDFPSEKEHAPCGGHTVKWLALATVLLTASACDSDSDRGSSGRPEDSPKEQQPAPPTPEPLVPSDAPKVTSASEPPVRKTEAERVKDELPAVPSVKVERMRAQLTGCTKDWQVGASGVRPKAMTLTMSCDWRQLQMAVEKENVERYSVRFTLEGEKTTHYRLVYVDGVVFDTGDDPASLKPYQTSVFLHEGKLFQLRPSAWVWDTERNLIGEPGTSKWYPTVAAPGGGDAKNITVPWAVFSNSCGKRKSACVFVGQPREVCRSFLNGNEYEKGFTPELPPLMDYPAGCVAPDPG